MRTWTIGQAAALAGVSVRTLHHYDAVGLLRPSGRSAAGYRLYSRDDLHTLHQILVYRELGFDLERIGRLMAAPGFDRLAALREQRVMLDANVRRASAVLDAVEQAITALEEGTTMEEQDLFGVFGDFDPKEYEAEAQQRWGDSDAYKQSARRTARYTKADWLRIKQENAAVTAAFVACMGRGLPPDSAEAGEAVSLHHAALERNFYDCPLEMYGTLADMWVADVRFTKNIDKAREGLAAYQRDAVKVWAAQQRA